MTLSHPPPDTDIPGDPAAVQRDLARSRLQKFVLALVITFFAVAIIALVLAGVHIYHRDYTQIPFEYMDVKLRDENGIWSMVSPAFVLSFEGYTQPHRWRSGGHLVDGRYPFTPWRKDLPTERIYGDLFDAKISYSHRRRTASFDLKTHHAEYIKHQNKLTVNGQEFSTAHGQVRLLIKSNGDVQRLDETKQ